MTSYVALFRLFEQFQNLNPFGLIIDTDNPDEL